MRTRIQGISRRGAIVLAALAIAGVAPASALAYWDYSGTLTPSAAYGEGQGNVGTWYIRLSRSNCNAKMELFDRFGGYWSQVSAPGGCSTSDWSVGYDTAGFSASHGINAGASDVFVNVRIDASV